MIKWDHAELSLAMQRKLVRLSRSAFCDTPVWIDAEALAMMNEIDCIF
ncbi:MAG: hypothetical protein AAGF20_11730 [Pseudomonadota bacterium]